MTEQQIEYTFSNNVPGYVGNIKFSLEGLDEKVAITEAVYKTDEGLSFKLENGEEVMLCEFDKKTSKKIDRKLDEGLHEDDFKTNQADIFGRKIFIKNKTNGRIWSAPFKRSIGLRSTDQIEMPTHQFYIS